MRLWLDTNAARSVPNLRRLCGLARSRGVDVVVHAQVYLEMRRQKRVLYGEGFKEMLFDDLLQRLPIRVVDIHFDQPTAARWADGLWQRYPTDRD
ncbi:hypothetical protein WME79_02410 [Sorangium sp. So ce726]|uniref:hypothetical protein n=1 Tax=Sorangium sp. So ce726 TaxID=3133319 RepID=UPI003F5DDFBA